MRSESMNTKNIKKKIMKIKLVEEYQGVLAENKKTGKKKYSEQDE